MVVDSAMVTIVYYLFNNFDVFALCRGAKGQSSSPIVDQTNLL